MPTITRLVQGKKNPNRVNLYLDDVFVFALSIDEVARHNLKKGSELNEAQITDLKETDQTDHSYGLILNFLSYRPRTIKEVRDRLYKYGVLDAVKQNLLIEKLKSKGYLDDLAFAKWFIESRNTHKLRSPRQLTAELAGKGINRETISQVISTATDPEVTLTRLLTKKLGLNRQLTILERQKIYAYLSRQGFAWDKIKEVVKSWESE